MPAYNLRWKERKDRRLAKRAARRTERQHVRRCILAGAWDLLHSARMLGLTDFGDRRVP